MTITRTTFRKKVREYDEARTNADLWADAKKSVGGELVAFMKSTGDIKATFEEDGETWTCTLVQPTSTIIDDEVLTALLKSKRLFGKVYKEVTTIVRDDDALVALIQSGKIAGTEVKKFTKEQEGTASVRITKKGK